MIVVGVAIVKSPAVNRLTVLFLMRNKKKGGAGQILSGDKQKVMRITYLQVPWSLSRLDPICS